MKIPKILYSKLLLGGISILLIAVFALELQQWRSRQAINTEINHLIAEQKTLEQKNLDLEQSLQYFGSDSYKERLAREQLGLQKEGEIVVNFPKLAIESANTEPSPVEPHNAQKWWNYLFLKKHN